MNYDDEDYVRYFTRDTVSWMALGWEGQAVLALMLHGKFDRSGVFDCDGHTASHAVTLVTRMPEAVVEAGLGRLFKSKTWVQRDGKIVWPKFVEAQNCRRSDKARQRESRDNRRREALGQSVTTGDEPSHPVTPGHAESQHVTPSQAEQSQAEPTPPESVDAGGERIEQDFVTECPPGLAKLCAERGITASLAKKYGVTEADVDAAIREYAEHFTTGRGFGEKRRHWAKQARGRVLDLHREGRLAGLGSAADGHGAGTTKPTMQLPKGVKFGAADL